MAIFLETLRREKKRMKRIPKNEGDEGCPRQGELNHSSVETFARCMVVGTPIESGTTSEAGQPLGHSHRNNRYRASKR
jgi:hypothetical protein